MSRRIWFVGAAGWTWMVCGAAAAQDAAPGQANVLSEVVVTAAPFAVSIDSTTTSVDVIKREALDEAPAAGLGDVLARTPGVRSSFFGPGASRPVIRGMTGPRVMVVTNGVGMIDASGLSPDHQVAADPQEAERIEVLRGPAALAYGGSAIGGVVNVIDDRIPQDYEAGAHGRLAASGSSVDDGAMVSGALKAGLGGRWMVTADGVRRSSEDYDTPLGRIANTFVDLNAWGAGASYVGDAAWGGLSAKRTTTDYGSAAEQDVRIGLEQTRVDARGGASFAAGPFASARLAAGWADYRHVEFEDGEPGTTFLSKGYEGRLELVQRDRGGWRGAVGVQGLRRDFDAIGDEALIPSTKISEAGVFTLQRLDRGGWGLEGGVRLDRRRLDSLVGDRSFTNLSASAAAFVRPAQDWFLGLSFSHASRAPTEEELFSDGPHPATGAYQIGDQALRREESDSVEASVHHSASRWTLDAHLYWASYDNFIDLTPTGEADPESELPIFRFVQGAARFRGGELEARYQAWASGERSFSLETAADFVRGEMNGAPAPRTPPWSATLAGVYEGPALSGRLEVRRVGEQDRIAPLETPTAGYTLVNASLTARPLRSRPDLKVFVNADNLTDELAREHVSVLKALAPLPGRNVRVGVGYRF